MSHASTKRNSQLAFAESFRSFATDLSSFFMSSARFTCSNSLAIKIGPMSASEVQVLASRTHQSSRSGLHIVQGVLDAFLVCQKVVPRAFICHFVSPSAATVENSLRLSASFASFCQVISQFVINSPRA